MIKVLDTGHIDGGAYRWVKLADGSSRVENWGPKGWTPGGASIGEIADAPPVGERFAAKFGIPLSDLGSTYTERSRRSPTPSEADDMTSRTMAEAAEEALAELRARAKAPSRSPSPSEMNDIWDRDTLDGLKEGRRRVEEKRAQSQAKLSAKQLRQAIQLGTQLAESDALARLAAKARQLAEHDRRRPRLVWDRDQIAPRQA
jgi:hypothetical protein